MGVQKKTQPKKKPKKNFDFIFLGGRILSKSKNIIIIIIIILLNLLFWTIMVIRFLGHKKKCDMKKKKKKKKKLNSRSDRQQLSPQQKCCKQGWHPTERTLFTHYILGKGNKREGTLLNSLTSWPLSSSWLTNWLTSWLTDWLERERWGFSCNPGTKVMS